MDKQPRICHDLKTDRTDIAQPLPGAMRVLPIFFFFAIIAGIGLSALFFMQTKESEKSKEEWATRAKQEEKTKLSVKGEQASIDTEVERANDVVNWINGAAPVQPLALAIARSMGETKSTIAEMALTRDKANPNQIKLRLDFDKGGQRQLDYTLEKLQNLGYRQFSAIQAKGDSGGFNYQATLIKTGNAVAASK